MGCEVLKGQYSKICSELFSKSCCLVSLESKFSIPPEWKSCIDLKRHQNPNDLSKFDDLKGDMLDIKTQLSDIDLLEWNTHTQMTNPAGFIVNQIKNKYFVELCTQAWCKMSEILVRYASVLPESGLLNSLHLCEAPGAFITSLNHHFKRFNKCLHWNWNATTLNPYYEGNECNTMISDDTLLYSTLDNWLFGPSNTGDIMRNESLQQIIDYAQSKGGYQLITGDGSFDCTDNPGEQEVITFPLQLCEVIVAFNCLTIGGNLVLKKFTFYEECNISLLYLLVCYFNQVHLFKPATSKSGNSEIYVVCLGFKGCDDYVLDNLKECYGKDHTKFVTLFPSHYVPTSFVQDLLIYAQYYAEQQKHMIQFNLDAFKLAKIEEGQIEKGLYKHMRKTKKRILEKWVKLTDMCSLPWSNRVNTHRFVPPWNINQIDKRKCGSFCERTDLFKDQELFLDTIGKELNKYWDIDQRSQFPRVFLIKKQLSSINFVIGAFLKNSGIKSSRFCNSNLLKVYQTLLDYAKSKNHPISEFSLLSAEIYSQSALVNSDSVEMSCKLGWITWIVSLLETNFECEVVVDLASRPLFLTRFSVDLLVCLCSVAQIELDFENESLKMQLNPYSQDNSKMCALLQDVHKELSQSSGDYELLEFLPISCLTDYTLYNAIARYNDVQLYLKCELLITYIKDHSDSNKLRKCC